MRTEESAMGMSFEIRLTGALTRDSGAGNGAVQLGEYSGTNLLRS